MAFLVFLLSSLLCLSSSSAISSDRTIQNLDLAKVTTQEHVTSLFHLWKMEHGRVYKNQEEEAKRLEIFRKNLNYIRAMNARRNSPHSHTLGLNKFADVCSQEFSRMYLQDPKYVSLPINKPNEEKDPEDEQKEPEEEQKDQDEEQKEQEEEHKDQDEQQKDEEEEHKGQDEEQKEQEEEQKGQDEEQKEQEEEQKGQDEEQKEQEEEQKDQDEEQKEPQEEQFSCDAPESWDWRKKGVITEVKYQGQCGSGWAFSAAGAIEAVNAIATGKLVSLSAQELIDCVQESQGCYNGWHYQSFEWVIRNGGIASEADYPYKGKETRCRANKVRETVTIDAYDTLRLSNQSATLKAADTEKALLCATLKQPISVSIDGRDFRFYTGGIYDGGSCTSPYAINHFVLIVGYGSENGVDYWIAKNSWGKDWGINGYIKIQRNTGNLLGVCGMNYFPSYPTKDSSEPLVTTL